MYGCVPLVWVSDLADVWVRAAGLGFRPGGCSVVCRWFGFLTWRMFGCVPLVWFSDLADVWVRTAGLDLQFGSIEFKDL